MLDINLFREEKGGDPELIRKSQRFRSSPVDLVDEVIALDEEWRQTGQFELDKIRQELNETSKEIGRLMAGKEDATELIHSAEKIKRRAAAKKTEVQEAKSTLDAKLVKIGNLVHETVPVSNDEASNAIVRTWGERRWEENLKNHVDLCRMLDIAAFEKGADVAGGRGYYLKNEGVFLNLALIHFGLAFLGKRGFETMHTPFFMRKESNRRWRGKVSHCYI